MNRYRIVRQPGYKDWNIEIEDLGWRGQIRRHFVQERFYDTHWNQRFDTKKQAQKHIDHLIWREHDSGTKGDWQP